MLPQSVLLECTTPSREDPGARHYLSGLPREHWYRPSCVENGYRVTDFRVVPSQTAHSCFLGRVLPHRQSTMADIHYNNMEVEALAKPEDVSTAVDEPPLPQEERASWKLYLVSKDFFEIVGSVVFGVVALLISKYAIPLHQRPIPAQELNTGEFVVNLNYDEVFKHETISSESNKETGCATGRNLTLYCFLQVLY